MESMVLKSTKLNFPINHVIFKEGEKASEIYFLRDGEVEISRKVDIN